MKSPEQILQSYWGYSSFRPLQQEIIETVLAGKDCLALMPTGGGKSVCYQLPALMKDGLCLVVSPLIALMQDQVKRLKETGIEAVCLHAGMQADVVARTLQNAVKGHFKLLYVSPERLQSHLFKEYLPELHLNLIAVDEAHCISQWGHDFRPDYLKIAYLRRIFREVPMLALTATATKEVVQDIVTQLSMRKPEVRQQSFKRENIFFAVQYSDNKIGDTITAIRQQSGSSIVYCRSRKQTELLTKHLKDFGIPALSYHAGMAKAKRDETQALWMEDRCKTMVATTAFGMGIDKPDVRTVIHFDVPEHLEAYYQEAGRAGRDGMPAKALMFFNSSDISRLKESPTLLYPPEAMLRKVYQHVCEYLQIPVGAAPDKYYDFDLADFCKKFRLPVLQTAGALKVLEREDLWTTSESLFRPATVHITCSRKDIDALTCTHRELSIVLTGLLRLYGTLFHYPTPVRLSTVAKHVKLTQPALHSCLQQLAKMNVIAYTEPKEGSQLYFHHTRTDSNHLLINVQRIGELRKRHEARTRVMISFLEQNTSCREKYLLQYFGEAAIEDCKHCDVCLQKTKNTIAAGAIQQQLLHCLATPKTLQEITSSFKHSAPQQITDVLRRLVDEGKIVRDVKGFFTCSKLPTD